MSRLNTPDDLALPRRPQAFFTEHPQDVRAQAEVRRLLLELPSLALKLLQLEPGPHVKASPGLLPAVNACSEFLSDAEPPPPASYLGQLQREGNQLFFTANSFTMRIILLDNALSSQSKKEVGLQSSSTFRSRIVYEYRRCAAGPILRLC